jgi:hypothetical protein
MTCEVIDAAQVRSDHAPEAARTERHIAKKELAMNVMFRPSTLLRRTLAADAAIGAACGVLMVLAQGPLSELLGLPAELLHYAGLALLPFAVALLLLALGEAPPRAAVWAVIALNATWVLGSTLLLFGTWVAPTLLGRGFLVVQIVVVLALTEFEYIGLQRGGSAVPAVA